MKRRTSISAIALGPASCLVAFKALAQGPSLAKSEKGGRPFRSVNVTEDGRRVVFFFDFACQYCASYHTALSNFARTVPKNIQALFVPVVNVADAPRKDEQILAAKLFYAASAVGNFIWFGPLKSLQKLFFRTPLVYMFVFGSFFYHDFIYWPFKAKPQMDEFKKTSRWGRLFDSYPE